MKKKRLLSTPVATPEWYFSPNIPMAVIRRYVRQVAERFQPDKIILFGSHAKGTQREYSDVDILVVMPARNEIDKSVRISLAFDPPFALDLIVRTPKHLARGLEDEDWFLREVIATGKVLYEKNDRPVGEKSRGRPHQRQKKRTTAPST